MTRSSWQVVLVSLLAVAAMSYLSFRVGVTVTMARGAYTDSIPIREERKCFDAKDMECLRVHWNMRAGITAEVARRALHSAFPTTVEDELNAYVQWAERIPSYQKSERK